MKDRLLISILVLIPSCTVITHPTAGKYTSLGGDAFGMSADARGYSFASNMNSPAFGKAVETIAKMWRNYLLARSFEFLAGKYYDHQGAVVDADTTVKLEELRNAASVQEANAALEALKVTGG